MRFLIIAALLVLPGVALAADPIGPIVPACAYTPGADPCQACDLVYLADNLLKVFVAVGVMAAAVMLAYAGILYVTASASPGNVDSAKKVFWTTFLGLIFILISFLIVDLILRTLTSPSQSLNVFTRINCVSYVRTSGGIEWAETDNDQSVVPANQQAELTADGQYRLPTQICNSPQSCQRLDPSIQCKEGVCYCTPELCQKLGLLQQNYDGTWQVTEDSIASVSNHGRICHQNGTCGDLNFTGRLKDLGDKFSRGEASPAEIDELAAGVKKIQAAGTKSGLNLQYEVRTEAQRQELIRRGVPPDQVIAYAGQTAPHFSYLQCKPSNPRNSCPVVKGN